MATEYPRQHVWTGDDNLQLTYLIIIQPNYHFLIKSSTVVAAIAVAVGNITPISDDISQIDIWCRPLYDYEVDKVSLKDGECIKLDEDSLQHLTTKPTNGEDHDNGEG